MPDIAKCSTTLPNTTSKQVRSRKKPGIRRVKKEAREEAKWLDAIESGNLEGISKEFTKITDPLRMTDRQRDIYFRDTCNQPTAPLLSIPTIYRAVFFLNRDIPIYLIKKFYFRKKQYLHKKELLLMKKRETVMPKNWKIRKDKLCLKYLGQQK